MKITSINGNIQQMTVSAGTSAIYGGGAASLVAERVGALSSRHAIGETSDVDAALERWIRKIADGCIGRASWVCRRRAFVHPDN